mmetsp:Transcript_36612/g.80207  ORF Transcript_36612/g.80207 Transcript_36612/m.80207 type:complete len:647 (-) Transcript_36612:59-1999(-)
MSVVAAHDVSAMASDTDLDDQQQELEALQSIFSDDLTVLDESPIQVELAISLELEDMREFCARWPWRTSLLSGAEASVGIGAGTGAADAGNDASQSSTKPAECKVPVEAAHAADAGKAQPRGKAVEGKAEGKAQGRGSMFVPRAIRLAESILEQRGLGPRPLIERGEVEMTARIRVRHLPPLRLSVTFCRGYPSTGPPSFRLSASWLSALQLSRLCAELDALAASQPGLPVVFVWAEWLQNCAAAHLGIDGREPLVLHCTQEDSYDSRALSEFDLADPEEGLAVLQAFDQKHSWWSWQQTAHLCNICFSEKPGTSFVELGGCGHSFCCECVGEMMRLHITEGSIAAIRCPLPDCKADVAPELVRHLVDETSYLRWHRLQVQKMLPQMEGVAFCPRCEANGNETPVLAEQVSDTRETPLAICDRCDYNFCVACRMAYHPTSQCKAQIEMLERRGQIKDEDRASRARRERLLEELKSLRLIMSETVPCPKCKMPINRSQGCNHMVCSNCHTHFCYRCGKDITEVGYDHFKAWACPTFDREEVERLQYAAGGEEAMENELEELRRQYPDQERIVWNFQPPPGAWRRHVRRQQQADVPCPTCRQWNGRSGTNNHIRCRICKTHFCYACRSEIRGVVTAHFKGAGACPQHE